MQRGNNMNTKVLFFAASLMLSAPVATFAADTKYDEDVVKSLNLKGDRADQVEKIMDSYKDQSKQVKDKARDQLGDLRDQKEDQLKAVLNDDEYKRYESMVEVKHEQKEKWAEKCGKDGELLGME
jgi:hypothetical protein